MSTPTESLILVSGLPGAGKTLYGVWLAQKYAEQGVPVYSWGLDGASSELFEVLPDDWKFSDWQDLPKGSVVIFDEAHKLLPQRTAGAPPKPIQDLTEIRHFGLRFIFITQDPRNLDVFVRRLIGRHYHLKRKMGFEAAIVSDFDRCADNPADFHEKKTAVTTVWKYPKKLFSLYKSSTLHLVKKKIPFKVLIYGLLAFSLVSYIAYSAWSFYSNVSDEGLTGTSSSETSETSVPVVSTTLEEYIHNTTPLSPVVPWTAPVYRELLKPVALPSKPICMIGGRTGCRCFTEQLTRIHLPDAVCRSLVHDGIYSPYHLAYSEQGVSGDGSASAGPAPTPANAAPATQVHLIE